MQSNRRTCAPAVVGLVTQCEPKTYPVPSHSSTMNSEEDKRLNECLNAHLSRALQNRKWDIDQISAQINQLN